MVAVIHTGKSLRNALHYNENKLKLGVAQLIHSKNFVRDTAHLGFTDKITTLQRLAQLNRRTEINSVHISLNFAPSEKPATATLQKIADAYMQKIGFGNQPYLVYQHHDAGHPHIHLVTTNIQRDGSRISLHNIGRNQSEKARREIEQEFKLVKAQRGELKKAYELRPVPAQKAQYGKAETKRAITHVLDAILPAYKYTSLAELNAVLKGYNILADRGGEGSRTYQRNGLFYRILDEKGQKLGVPIKASLLHNKPGLKYLEQQFARNKPLRQAHKQRVRNSVDLALSRQRRPFFAMLSDTLKKEGIHLVLRQNAQGLVYGLTYIDHTTKCVFNGSDLGKPYSANAMRERCAQKQARKPALKPPPAQPAHWKPSPTPQLPEPLAGSGEKPGDKIIHLLEAEPAHQSIASELLRDAHRKRKRKRLHH